MCTHTHTIQKIWSKWLLCIGSCAAVTDTKVKTTMDLTLQDLSLRGDMDWWPSSYGTKWKELWPGGPEACTILEIFIKIYSIYKENSVEKWMSSAGTGLSGVGVSPLAPWDRWKGKSSWAWQCSQLSEETALCGCCFHSISSKCVLHTAAHMNL
jgi:hypothetical protein